MRINVHVLNIYVCNMSCQKLEFCDIISDMDNNTIPRFEGAIFDMDGLMLDTEQPTIPLWAEAAKHFGKVIDTGTVIRGIGLNGKDTKALFLEECGTDFPYDEILVEFNRLVEIEFNKGIALKKGLIRLLDSIAAKGIPLAVATSTRRARAIEKLQKTGIFSRFDALAGGDEIANGKPAPDIFLLAAERIGKAPSSCIGFEDSPAGLRGLHAAGIRSVFVKDTVEPPPEILAAVWRRYADLGEAAELFD